MLSYNNAQTIQGPHCLIDIKLTKPLHINSDLAIDTVNTLANTLEMKRLGEARIIRSEDGSNTLSIYQIVATSHIIIHFTKDYIYADLFSCEPFNIDKSVSVLLDNFGKDAVIQYCQRNLTKAPDKTRSIPMIELNKITSNPKTFTHALVNWYDGNERLLGDIEHGTQTIKYALDYLHEREHLPPANIMLVDVAPVEGSWDKGGFSGGYINLKKQLTMHTFAGVNGAFTDIMAHTFDLEKILAIIQSGFRFKFFEIDGILQRMEAF
jgi:S-adenosylmethionine/arginine decarboxylase-like enzyme